MLIERTLTHNGLVELMIPFPENPKTVDINGTMGLVYISPEEMRKIIQDLSDEVKIEEYENIIVNSIGGYTLNNRLGVLQSTMPRRIHIVEYHKGQKPIIRVPKEIMNKKNLIIDDICETGRTIYSILNDSPDAHIVVVVIKANVPNQIPVYQRTIFHTGLVLDNLHIGGMGNDFGNGRSQDHERNYEGIVTLQVPIDSP